ncbi:MAG: DNA-binding transcriptional regulator/RsmH inhibitor MraZ [Bradyrhizobium sp.]|jgi:DNA-binding transcriptional regulator/RsmH inhibitor MraZ
MSFSSFCIALESNGEQKISVDNTSIITFTSKAKKSFSIKTSVVIAFIKFLKNSHVSAKNAWNNIESKKDLFNQYEEKSYRAIFETAKENSELDTITTLSGSQTHQLTAVITKLICYLGKFEFEGIEKNTRFDVNSVVAALNANSQILENLKQKYNPPSVINLEAKFREWMSNLSLAETSIEKYSKGTASVITKLAKNELTWFKDLFSISTTTVLDKLTEYLEGKTEWVETNRSGNGMYIAGIKKYREFLLQLDQSYSLPKPFLLLAGISGTGKTLYV